MRKFKEEKGSVTTIVLVTILFFITILSAVYLTNTTLRKSQLKSQLSLKGTYENELANAEKIIETKTLPSTEETKPYFPDDTFTKILDTDLNTGLVINDSKENEYVWVEVPKSIYTNSTYANTTSNPSHSGGNADGTVTSNTDYTGIKNVLKEYTADYKNGSATQSYNWTDEWYAWNTSSNTIITATTSGITEEQKDLTNGCGLSLSEYNTLYNNMLKSVYTYGGFWIGRYEAGDEESTARTEESAGVSNPAVSKANVIPYNWVTCQQAQTLASSMAPNGYTSSLMFGVQWDLVLKYLETKATWDTTTNTAKYYLSTNSVDWGNYGDNLWNITESLAKYSTNSGASWSATPYNKTSSGGILLTTGASQSFSKMNIFDLAGNVWEWTLEKASITGYPCAYRGGTYSVSGSVTPASSRNFISTTSIFKYVGFRVALFCNAEI